MISFDPEENWACVGDVSEGEGFWEQIAFFIQPVAQHEIGHALGLRHTTNPDDVMAPYYKFGGHGAAPPLSEADKEAARAILAS